MIRINIGRSRSPVVATFALVIVLAAGCDKPQPLGDANAIIVGTSGERWEQIGDEVQDALEPRAFTVRDERIFSVTQIDPADPRWENLRRFRQVLLIGEPGDPAVAEALDAAEEPLPQLPALVRAEDVWARGQQITALVLPPGAEATAAQPLLEELGDRYLREFREYIRVRMFASGADTALADSLSREAGFSLLLPEVYYGRQIGPETVLFRNDYPDPSQLIRSVLVTWRASGQAPISAETALEWRRRIVEEAYDPTQVRDTAEMLTSSLDDQGAEAVQVQGIWSNPPGEFPAAGPFLTRLVRCPQQNRDYLLDAWLYAPGEDKYQYLFQLLTILDSFSCGSSGETGA